LSDPIPPADDPYSPPAEGQAPSRARPKSALAAGVLSLAMPGLGQAYNDQFGRALAYYLGRDALFTAAGISSGWLSVGAGYLIWTMLPAAYALVAATQAFVAAKRLAGRVTRWHHRWYVCAAVAALDLLVLVSFQAAWIAKATGSPRAHRTPTRSMEPGVLAGDVIVADYHWYRSHAPAKGEIVVFEEPGRPGIRYIRRVIGLGGERLEIRNKQVFINDHPFAEPWPLQYDFDAMASPPRRYDFTPVEIPAGSVFLLGDNRDSCRDSRAYGAVPLDHVLARATLVLVSSVRERIGKSLVPRRRKPTSGADPTTPAVR
jgi:signal peptidase I